jgi:hypothetical protein
MTQWKSPSTAVNLMLIQSLPLSNTEAESHLRSEAAPSEYNVSYRFSFMYLGASLTIAHVVTHRLANSVLTVIPQLAGVL